MPLYEFECCNCGVVFEELVQTHNKSTETICPACGSRKVEQKISAFASIVKGGVSKKSESCAPSGG